MTARRKIAVAREQLGEKQRGRIAAIKSAQRLIELEREVAELKARINTAVTWLVTVDANHPAGIIAERAGLALAALRERK